MEERLERAPIGILEADGDGTVRALNDAARELLDTSRAAAVGGSIAAVFPDSVEASVPRAFDSPPEDEHSIEEYYPTVDRWLDVSLVPTGEAVTLYLRDVTDKHRIERRLSTLDADLNRLSIINQLISDVLAELVEASTREEIAATICERLGETDIYEFAWVGERDLGTDEIAVRAGAGTTGRTLDRIEDCLDRGVDIPEQRAIDTGTPEVVQPLGEDETVPEQVRRAAFADGLQSLLAIPLTYASNVYGVVGIYTADQDAFSERERASFGTLGEMAGFAVNATRNRNLLLSDTVVELTFQIGGPGDPLVSIAAEHGASLTVDGLVSGEQLRCYLAVSGGDPSAIAATAAATEGIESTRLISDGEASGTVEVALDEGTLLGHLTSLGVTLESARFEDGEGELVVELPPEEDVRRIAETVRRAHDADVIAKRERERDVTTAREFREALSQELTDRQEDALKTAFFANYFESPRGSTAAEVAHALDITGPTLLHHLRAGQRKLLAEFLDTDESTDRRT
jgi:predicted DNA binding protein/PAS domain-containing protein